MRSLTVLLGSRELGGSGNRNWEEGVGCVWKEIGSGVDRGSKKMGIGFGG